MPVRCLQYEDVDALQRYQPSLLLHSPEVEVSPATVLTLSTSRIMHVLSSQQCSWSNLRPSPDVLTEWVARELHSASF